MQRLHQDRAEQARGARAVRAGGQRRGPGPGRAALRAGRSGSRVRRGAAEGPAGGLGQQRSPR